MTTLVNQLRRVSCNSLWSFFLVVTNITSVDVHSLPFSVHARETGGAEALSTAAVPSEVARDLILGQRVASLPVELLHRLVCEAHVVALGPDLGAFLVAFVQFGKRNRQEQKRKN